MAHEPTSTVRARRLRERRARGVVMVAPVEIGEGGIAFLVGNDLLKEHETRARRAVGAACLSALEQWAEGHGARSTGQKARIAHRARRARKPRFSPVWERIRQLGKSL